MTVYGTLNATSALIDVDPNSTGPDTFSIIPSANTPITVTGGQGMDTLDFNAEGLAVTLSGNTITAAGMQPVTFTNIAVVNITNAANGGAHYTLTGTSGQGDTMSLVGTGQGAGTVTLNGVALSFSGVASFNYQGSKGDTISVTPFATSLIPWNLAVAVAGGAGYSSLLTYNSVASPADTVTLTGRNAGTIGSPGLAAVQFSNFGAIIANASQSTGDALTVNLLGTSANGAINTLTAQQTAYDTAISINTFAVVSNGYGSVNLSDTTGPALFEVVPAAALQTNPTASVNFQVVGSPVYNDNLFVMGAAGEPAAVISKSVLAGSGSVTVGTLNPLTYENIGAVKYLPVNSAPKVIQQPANQTVLANTVATFTALATANPTATVQWQESTNKGKTFQNIAGATSLSFSFTPQASDNGDQFKAVFTSSVGKPAVTTPAKLTVTVPAAQHVNSLPVKSAAEGDATAGQPDSRGRRAGDLDGSSQRRPGTFGAVDGQRRQGQAVHCHRGRHRAQLHVYGPDRQHRRDVRGCLYQCRRQGHDVGRHPDGERASQRAGRPSRPDRGEGQGVVLGGADRHKADGTVAGQQRQRQHLEQYQGRQVRDPHAQGPDDVGGPMGISSAGDQRGRHLHQRRRHADRLKV